MVKHTLHNAHLLIVSNYEILIFLRTVGLYQNYMAFVPYNKTHFRRYILPRRKGFLFN